EAPWPHLDALERATRQAGRTLVERLAIYPAFVPRHGVPARRGRGGTAAAASASPWLDPALLAPVLALADGEGVARAQAWARGALLPLPRLAVPLADGASAAVARILARAGGGEELTEAEIAALFAARGRDFAAVCAAADELRARRVGDVATYVVNRNI